jgi:outer membrane protein
MKSLIAHFLAPFFIFLSMPLLALDCCNPCDDFCCEPCCDSSWGINAEFRVAYYHPSSKRVRHIYGDGWADYQFELSKSFKGFGGLGGGCCSCFNDIEWRVWAGVSGFSKKGHSIGFHDDTKLQLVPISFGLKIFYPIFCNTKVFIGGAACYSLLRIHDHSEYVHQHVRKESWGGLFQSGITYDFCSWAYVSVFFDYYFQRFHFHDDKLSSFSGSSDSYLFSSSSSRYIERSDLNMNGYKVGAGIGISF